MDSEFVLQVMGELRHGAIAGKRCLLLGSLNSPGSELRFPSFNCNSQKKRELEYMPRAIFTDTLSHVKRWFRDTKKARKKLVHSVKFLLDS